VVRLKHLPDEADSSDIRKFFKKIDIPDGGVRILGGEKGVVYITVSSDEDLKRTLERDGKKLHPAAPEAKSKRVKISESSSREMQRAIEEIVHGPDVARQMRRERERAVTPPAPGDVYVELADMPQDTGLKEIVNFFTGLQVTQVKLVGGGIAYVQFKNVDLKQEALTYDLRFMSSKFVHVRHLLESIWDGCQVPSIKNSKKKPESVKVATSVKGIADSSVKEKKPTEKAKTGACVQVSGLSKEVNKKMVVHEIFKGYKITNYGLYIETENSICTGKCYIEFVSPDIRTSAVKTSLTSRHKIKVSNISHDEMETKVRQHRKFLKQSEFLKRQAAKERQSASEEQFKGLVEKVREKMVAKDATPERDRVDDMDMNESSSEAEGQTPEPGLTSFYGDYTETPFDSKPSEVISVQSTPEKSPIEIASNSDEDDESHDENGFKKVKPVEKFKPKKKIQMNLKKKDPQSVLSRLEREEKKKIPSPQPEPDSTTKMESETSEEETSMPFNPMQVMMMQQMMMHMTQQPPVTPYSSQPITPSNTWEAPPPIKKLKFENEPHNYTSYRPPVPATVVPPPPPATQYHQNKPSTFDGRIQQPPPRGHFPGQQATPRAPFDQRPRFDHQNHHRGGGAGQHNRGAARGNSYRPPPRMHQGGGWKEEETVKSERLPPPSQNFNQRGSGGHRGQRGNFGQASRGHFAPRGQFPPPRGPPGGAPFAGGPRGGGPSRGGFRPRGVGHGPPRGGGGGRGFHRGGSRGRGGGPPPPGR